MMMSKRGVTQSKRLGRRWLNQWLASRANKPAGENIFAAATAMANQFGSVNLGQGFPSFPTPEFAKQCAVEAVLGNHNQYTRPGGNPLLVETLSDFYTPLLDGRKLDAMNEIAICPGAQEGIYNILATFCNEGDELLCIEPYFDSYKKAADLVGVQTKGIPLRMDPSSGAKSAASFKLNMEELERSITEKTKLLIINTPHNPTGKVFSKDELKDIAQVVARFPNLMVLSDEVYEFMTFDGLKHERFALIDGMWDRTISIFSAGKTFSATGWRVGYYFGPRHFIQPLIQTQSIISFCTPTPMQVAVANAFKVGQQQGYFTDLAQTLQRKRDALCDSLRQSGLDPVLPQGGYFVMADTSRVPVPPQKQRDVAVNRWLTENVGVTGIPTSYFYRDHHTTLADHSLRFAFCKTDEEILAAREKLSSLHAQD